MINDDYTSATIIAFCFIVIAFVPGFLFGTLTSRGETEQKNNCVLYRTTKCL